MELCVVLLFRTKMTYCARFAARRVERWGRKCLCDSHFFRFCAKIMRNIKPKKERFPAFPTTRSNDDGHFHTLLRLLHFSAISGAGDDGLAKQKK